MEVPRPKTAADYAAIAIAPLLIFLMISSLANFLMLVLYHGNQPQRVAWTLLMFTMGTVAIARVAIERDRGYSLGYLGILGFVAFLAMLKFVDSPIFSAFILGLIAYLSDRIVHDCTLIDDNVDASGQGLIDSGRLFVRTQLESRGAQPGPSPEATPNQDATPNQETTRDDSHATGRRRQHQPGRTVMYLALAALPLFGLGQFFLREDAATWGRAQWLLAVYLFSSLSLLMTTSFLGLRRYLRQRKVDMPSDVSVGWLSGGLFLVTAILLIAYLAPLPGHALASFQLPDFLDSPGELTASRFGWGEEAAEKKSPDASSTQQDSDPSDKEIQDIAAKKGAPKGAASDGQRDQGPAGQSQGGKQSGGSGSDQGNTSSSDSAQSSRSSQPSGEPSADAASNQSRSQPSSRSEQNSSAPRKQDADSQQGSDQASGEPKSAEPRSREQTSRDQNEADGTNRDEESRGEESRGEESRGEESRDEESRDEGSERADSSEPAEDRSPANQDEQELAENDVAATEQEPLADQAEPSSPSSLPDLMPTLSGIVRLLVLLSLLGIVAAFVWLNREAILSWWRRMTEPQPTDDVGSLEELVKAEAVSPPRPFHTYRNPFGNEQDPRRIVVITFAAFEAWSREQGSTRGKDETPSEFIRRVAQSLPQLHSSATQVVDAYNRIVYGRGRASERDLAAAKEVWNRMRPA